MARPVVHIVGGGIGGLALAAALVRRSWPVEVYEGAPSYAEVGGGHWLYANALAALDTIDPAITDDLVARGMPFEGFWFETASGLRLLREATSHYTPCARHAPVVLKRWDIIDRLAARVPSEHLHFGRRLERIDGDTLVFADGERICARVVVGADGIHSVVRRDKLTTRGPRFSGQTGLWGIGPGSLPGEAARHFTELWGDGVRMGFTAVTGGSVYWFLVVRGEVLLQDNEARKALVLERAARFPPALADVVQETPAARIHVNPLWDMPPIRRWWVPGAVCIGDAVHAMTPNLGQGGCQAIEDAAVLADLMGRGGDLDRAFATYQALRWRRASVVTLLARILGDMAQMSGPLRALRDILVRATPKPLIRPALRWVMT